MYSFVLLLTISLSYSHTAADKHVTTNPLLLTGENADALPPPLNTFGSTAVFPDVFQLGSGAGRDLGKEIGSR